MSKYLAIGLLLSCCNAALAGGSYEPVRIKILTINGDDYNLVVEPILDKMSSSRDPYLGNCTSFSVISTYDTFWWLTRSGPSKGKDSHRRALELLKAAYAKNERIYFGWMGSGFERINANDPCNVKSKGLDIIEDVKAIVSFYGSV